MAELSEDIHEQILVKSGVKDLTRFKCVSNSWRTLISDSRFVKNHVKHNNNNNNSNEIMECTRIRIIPYKFSDWYDRVVHDFDCDIAGSSNGLVCIVRYDTEILVVNPITRELKELQKPLVPEKMIKPSLCCGFGYDSSIDDYKVVLGFKIGKHNTCFQVLTLRSNMLKVIGNVKYRFIRECRVGTLCNGAIHWFMKDEKKERVILSFDLSNEEFKEIPQPDNPRYHGYTLATKLGVTEQNCLCIFRRDLRYIWVMKNYNVKHSWKTQRVNNKGAAHVSKNLCRCLSTPDDRRRIIFQTSSKFCAPVFVESLVSPNYANNRTLKRKSHAMYPSSGTMNVPTTKNDWIWRAK